MTEQMTTTEASQGAAVDRTKKQPSLVAKLQQEMARARIGITLEHRTLMRRYTEKGIMIMKSLMKPLKNSLHSCCFMRRRRDALSQSLEKICKLL